MSFELPFSKPSGWSIQKIVLLGLILVHSVWIVVHLNLVSRDMINQWKLGGYGMYTGPHPTPLIHFFDARFEGFEVTMDQKDVLTLARDNLYFIFRCRPLKVESIKKLLRNNPRYIGVPLRFIVTEKEMKRNPIRPERLPHAILEIRWTGKSTFDYAGKVCGKIFRGEAELKP
ncbi:hypothetical protein [Anderseniella sp. Alg231-50]|uniref:hypothetical protein n=1 Tax=Anderseniella sp. Alg231-50 TaxID=1922226 RepID=UPI000D561CF5